MQLIGHLSEMFSELSPIKLTKTPRGLVCFSNTNFQSNNNIITVWEASNLCPFGPHPFLLSVSPSSFPSSHSQARFGARKEVLWCDFAICGVVSDFKDHTLGEGLPASISRYWVWTRIGSIYSHVHFAPYYAIIWGKFCLLLQIVRTAPCFGPGTYVSFSFLPVGIAFNCHMKKPWAREIWSKEFIISGTKTTPNRINKCRVWFAIGLLVHVGGWIPSEGKIVGNTGKPGRILCLSWLQETRYCSFAQYCGELNLKIL